MAHINYRLCALFKTLSQLKPQRVSYNSSLPSFHTVFVFQFSNCASRWTAASDSRSVSVFSFRFMQWRDRNFDIWDSHSGTVAEDSILLWCYSVSLCKNLPTFRKITLR